MLKGKLSIAGDSSFQQLRQQKLTVQVSYSRGGGKQDQELSVPAGRGQLSSRGSGLDETRITGQQTLVIRAVGQQL